MERGALSDIPSTITPCDGSGKPERRRARQGIDNSGRLGGCFHATGDANLRSPRREPLYNQLTRAREHRRDRVDVGAAGLRHIGSTAATTANDRR
jgi:hypothetical protein